MIEKLGPYVERSEWVADLVARSGIEEAKVMYALARRYCDEPIGYRRLGARPEVLPACQGGKENA